MIPVALVVVPAYLFAMSLGATTIARRGPGALNVLVILSFWNAGKFAWLALTMPFLLLRNLNRCQARRTRPNGAAGIAGW